MSIPFRTIFPVWLACLVTAGCGAEDRPTLVPVTGWVTYRGEPVGGAHVCFFGESSEPTAIATTGNDGGFQLTTMDENDGAAPGSYVVTVSKLEGSPMNVAPPIPFDPVADMEAAAQKKEQPVAGKSRLPQRYAAAANSPLKVTIPAGGQSDLKIELAD